MNILDTWARATTRRMQPGGDLHVRPKTREEMTAPLTWHEKQQAVCRRYGELSDGTIGYAKVWVHPDLRVHHPDYVE